MDKETILAWDEAINKELIKHMMERTNSFLNLKEETQDYKMGVLAGYMLGAADVKAMIWHMLEEFEKEGLSSEHNK